MDPAGVASAGHNGAAASSSLSQKALLEPTLTKTRPCHPSISMLDWMEEEESVRKKKMALEAQAGEESKGQEKPWRSCMRTGSKPSSGCFKEERPSLGWGHGQSFHESSDLLVPQQLHVGQKPHKCLECGKLFNWSFNLLYHQWVHTREWPYSIKQCWMILDPPTAQHGCFWGVSTCPELRMGPVGAAGAILVVLGDPSAGSQGNLGRGLSVVQGIEIPWRGRAGFGEGCVVAEHDQEKEKKLQAVVLLTTKSDGMRRPQAELGDGNER
ncbi:hypothetical protein DUI87_32180 [Hirundo rustica rustica]|uniref:C2H2-type domain-containing protein n=1 Tax=Hirundo rustica rustica TaxID=333673 RepID=A0A3M0IY26_HIRRU|nr:hypothetical protein DUI87_32180 [Hirundo rustica rustica]